MSEENNKPGAVVIDLAALRPGERAPIVLLPQERTGCQHRQVTVSARLRTVHCTDCRIALDPVQVLIEQAEAYRRMDYRTAEMKRIEESVQARAAKAKARREAAKAKRDALPRCGARSADGLVCTLEAGHKKPQHWQWSGGRGLGWFGPGAKR